MTKHFVVIGAAAVALTSALLAPPLRAAGQSSARPSNAPSRAAKYFWLCSESGSRTAQTECDSIDYLRANLRARQIDDQPFGATDFETADNVGNAVHATSAPEDARPCCVAPPRSVTP